MSLEKIIKGIKKVKQSLKRLAFSAVIGLALTAGTRETNAENLEYEVIEIAPYNIAGGVHSINNFGDVVGDFSQYYSDLKKSFWKPFLYKNSTFSPLDVPKEFSIDSIKINDFGEILMVSTAYPCGAYIYKNGKLEDTGFSQVYFIRDMNNKTEFVDMRNLYKKGEKIKLIPSSTPMPNYEIYGINDNTQIVGKIHKGHVDIPGYYGAEGHYENWAPFIWQDGVIKELEQPSFIYNGVSYYYPCEARFINNKGKIVGSLEFPFPGGYSERIFVWDETGKLIQLIEPPQKVALSAFNDIGQIVGNFVSWYSDPFLYQDGQFIYLRDFVPKNKSWYLASAVDINNRQQIIGIGLTPTAGSPRPVMVLMNPIPLSTETLKGDINYDGKVDITDLRIFVGSWLEERLGDLKEDGIVNLKDLSELAEHWLEER